MVLQTCRFQYWYNRKETEKSVVSMDSINQDRQGNSTENVDEKTNLNNEKSKNFRHRKKKFYNFIRQQMEFYFGDANLSKDRFLMKLIKANPFVPLETFLKFNKLKKLTNSIEDIAKGISNSTLLELDDSRTKVRRKTEIQQERDVDDKTIYVESLPLHADHDWVIKVFSRYGPVAYVSLPRYKKSRKIKEFGFVEFENVSSVEKALKAFKEFDGVLHSESFDPSNLTSVTSFVKEQNEMETNNTAQIEKIEKNKANESEVSVESKRKKEKESSDEESDLIPVKKLKTESEENNESELVSDQFESGNEEEGNNKKKKNRKNQKKKTLKIIDDSNFRELKVLSKKDWKRLRNKYLNMQREKLREFKKIRNRSSNQSQKVVRESNKINPKQQTHSVNFYCVSDSTDIDDCSKNENGNLKNKSKIEGDKTKHEQNVAEGKEPLFHLESGIIVRTKFIEPCIDVKSFKADMKQYNCVKYVDIKEGGLESYLRCDNPINAEKLVKQISCAEYQCQILNGDAEKEYWEKIMKDRELKLNKKVKVKQKRGHEKIVKVLAKHIRFDDDE